MISIASGAMLPGVAEREPSRSWFGKGGCVERHDDGTNAVFLRGELLGIYASEDAATRDLFISVVMSTARGRTWRARSTCRWRPWGGW